MSVMDFQKKLDRGWAGGWAGLGGWVLGGSGVGGWVGGWAGGWVGGVSSIQFFGNLLCKAPK